MADALITEANRRWWVLVAMTGSLSMILLDQTVVSVALPSIQNARPVALPPGRSRRSRTFSQSPSEQAAAAGKLPATESAELTGIVQDAALAGIRWAYIVGGLALALASVVAFAVLRHVEYEKDPDKAVAAPLG
jgi:hypothetical protein